MSHDNTECGVYVCKYALAGLEVLTSIDEVSFGELVEMIESSALFSFDPIAMVDLRRDIKLLIENLSCLGFTNAPTSFDEDADDGSIEILNNSSTRSDSESDDSESDDSELEDDDEQEDAEDKKNEDMESKFESRRDVIQFNSKLLFIPLLLQSNVHGLECLTSDFLFLEATLLHLTQRRQFLKMRLKRDLIRATIDAAGEELVQFR
jgi:hypothetical protein